MPLAFAQFLYELQDAGWSETFYATVDTLDALQGPASSLLYLRQPMMGPGTKLQAVRIGFAGGQRNVREYPVGSVAFPVSNTLWVGDAEEDTVINFRLEDSAGHHRQFLLGGLPEPIIQSTQTFDPNAIDGGGNSWGDYARAFDRLLQHTSGTPFWQLKVRDKPTAYGGGVPPDGEWATTVSGAAYGLSNEEIVLTLLPTEVPLKWGTGTGRRDARPGDRVIVRGYKGGIHVNGVWILKTVNNDNTVTLGPHRRPVALNVGALNVGSCVVYGLNYTGLFIDRAAWVNTRLHNKKRGRPFGQPVGRRVVR